MAATVDILLGRPVASSGLAERVQLLLIALWHWLVFIGTTVFIDWWLGSGATRGGEPVAHPLDLNRALTESTLPFVPAVILALTLVEGLIGWGIFRIATRGRWTSTRVFVRSWLRACWWGTLVVPLIPFLVATTTRDYGLGVNAVLLGHLFLIIGPSLLVRDEWPRQRRARWRPQCPECGYSLRGAAANRCPECGCEYPSPNRFYRRWAIQRLLWDRRQRGSPPIAYIRSLLTVVCCPCRAAWRVAIPDRYGRAARWAAAHLVLTALLGTLLGSARYYGMVIVYRLRGLPYSLPVPVGEEYPGLEEYPTGRVLIWATHSFGAWLIACAALPLVAILVGVIIPGRHPAAKGSIAKWSLYATPILIPALLLSVGLETWRAVRNVLRLDNLLVEGSESAWLWLLTLIYALWWALGVAVNPYLSRRGWRVFLAHFAGYLAVWTLLRFVLFHAGALEALL